MESSQVALASLFIKKYNKENLAGPNITWAESPCKLLTKPTIINKITSATHTRPAVMMLPQLQELNWQD